MHFNARTHARTHTHTSRSSEWNAVSLLRRNFTFSYTRCNRHREQKILSGSSGSYVMCEAAIITSQKCQMSIATSVLFELPVTGWIILTQTSSVIYFSVRLLFQSSLYHCQAQLLSLGTGKHLLYFQCHDTDSGLNICYVQVCLSSLAAASVGVPLTFLHTLQSQCLRRMRRESEFEHEPLCDRRRSASLGKKKYFTVMIDIATLTRMFRATSSFRLI